MRASLAFHHQRTPYLLPRLQVASVERTKARRPAPLEDSEESRGAGPANHREGGLMSQAHGTTNKPGSCLGKAETMTPAFIYARVSGKGQIDGDGFPRQLEACHALADRDGFAIVDTFQELGVSGTKELDNRPALQALYAGLESGTAAVIIIEKLDRLARDLMVQETIISDLQKRGVLLVSALEPDLCSGDPSRKLVRQIFGAIAEYDRAMTVLKLRGARQRTKARTGRCEGVKPFGTFPAERPTLDKLTRLRQHGSTCAEIADELNRDGIPSRSGKLWSGPVIAKILRRVKPDTSVRPACASPLLEPTNTGSSASHRRSPETSPCAPTAGQSWSGTIR